MTRYYRRKKTGAGENLRAGLVAGALAAMVAAASFYLVRVFLSREAMEPIGGDGSRRLPEESLPEDED